MNMKLISNICLIKGIPLSVQTTHDIRQHEKALGLSSHKQNLVTVSEGSEVLAD